MGIITRQSIQLTIMHSLSVVIGFISVMFIYPLESQTAGEANNIIGIGFLISGLFVFGTGNLAIHGIRENIDNDSSAFRLFSLPSLILVICIFTLVGSVLLFLLKSIFINSLLQSVVNKELLEDRFVQFMLLAFLLSVCNLFTSYSSNFNKTFVPTLLMTFGLRLLLPIIILLVHITLLPKEHLDLYIIFFYFSIAIILFFLLKGYSKQNNFLTVGFQRLINKKTLDFLFYSGVANICWTVAYKLDTVIIGFLLGYGEVVVYMLPLFIAAVFDFPTSSLTTVISPIIRKSLQDNDISKIKSYYQKSSTNLYFAGLVLFLLIISSYDDLVSLSSKPDLFVNTKYVFLLLAVGKLVDMVTGVNSIILAYSSFYKYNLLFISILAILTAILSFYFVPVYGIIAMASSSLFAILLFNILKTIFIYFKLDIQPITVDTLKLTLIAIVIFFVVNWIPLTGNSYVDIILRSCLLVFPFFIIAYVINISEEFTEIIDKYHGLIKKAIMK
ncbi:MAG: hypothetical protein IPN29_13785 [Saprospiraceae bacterium]|nr:hypothetical protein [Saprospiraceae bacterium]